MSLTPSTMVQLGTAAPSFQLPDTDGTMVELKDFARSRALLVAFICNHCPFVKHVQAAFTQLARDYQAKGVAIVAISSNDVKTHPEDSPAHGGRKSKKPATFPYLYDETQEVARAYEAACTPDFFFFRRQTGWPIAGRWTTTPSNGKPNTGADLRAAAGLILAGKSPSQIRSRALAVTSSGVREAF